MTIRLRHVLSVLLLVWALPAWAQQGHHHHHHHEASSREGEPESVRAFREVNDRMHRDMDIAFTGDADVDFVKGMIAHHEGAIGMAEVVLRFGKDPDILQLAEEIVEAQQAEIDLMRRWLAGRNAR